MKQKYPLIDKVLALGVGAVVLALLFAWPFAGIHPFAAEDLEISAGLVPQDKMLPGLGIFLASLLFRVLPYDVALAANGLAAKMLVAACGLMAYVIFRGMMTLASGVGVRDGRRRRLAIRVAAGLGAVAFACSDPLGHAAMGLTGSTFTLFVAVLAFCLYVRLMETARGGYAVSALFATGVLCAETPLGWAVLTFGVAMTVRYLALVKTPEWTEFLDPIRMQRTKWSMTFVFLGAFVFGALGETFAYAMLDGLKAHHVTAGDLPLLYASAYWHALIDSVNVTGACLFAMCTLIPFALTLLMIVPATDEDRFLSFKHSVVYVLAGTIAFLQLAPYPVAWFWTMADGVAVSRPLIAFGALLAGAAFAWAVFVLCVEVLCRDYEHIENVLCEGYLEDEDEDDGAGRRKAVLPESGGVDVRSVRLSFRRLAVLMVPFLLAGLVVWGRRLPEDRELQEILHAFVCETIAEAGDVRHLFTDGSLDAELRLEARRSGKGVLPIPVLGGMSARDAYIRRSGCVDFEDRVTLGVGAAEALSAWVEKKPERLKDVAVQLAFEIFSRNRHVEPLVYGALVRPAGGDLSAAEASVARCRALADRILSVHARGVWRHATDAFLKDRFLFAQFRLALMSRLRSIQLDGEKRVQESLDELAYSDRLNGANPALVEILHKLDWVRRQSGESITPREGLEMALRRADFAMARRYAMPILREDEDEPQANFALGMSYYAEEQYAKAESFLTRALKRKPEEAAIYNNLALVCLKMGRLEEARKNIDKALEKGPDRVEFKDTAKQIQRAVQSRSSVF